MGDDEAELAKQLSQSRLKARRLRENLLSEAGQAISRNPEAFGLDKAGIYEIEKVKKAHTAEDDYEDKPLNYIDLYKPIFYLFQAYILKHETINLCPFSMANILHYLINTPEFDHDGVGLFYERSRSPRLVKQHEWQQRIIEEIALIHQYAVKRTNSEPADQQRTAPEEHLNNRLVRLAAPVLDALKAGGDDASALREMFAQAGYPVGQAATSTHTPVTPPSMPLPTRPLKLWADNTEGLPATAFVAKYYAPWIEAGVLSLKMIGAFDPDLPKAYKNRVSRHPSEAVALVRSTRSDRIEDPQEAIDRVRDAARESAARRRAAASGYPTKVPG